METPSLAHLGEEEKHRNLDKRECPRVLKPEIQGDQTPIGDKPGRHDKTLGVSALL
jgi:hypothetical protein